MKYCTHCGNKLKDYDNFCSNCGHRQDATIEEPKEIESNNTESNNQESNNPKSRKSESNHSESNNTESNNLKKNKQKKTYEKKKSVLGVWAIILSIIPVAHFLGGFFALIDILFRRRKAILNRAIVALVISCLWTSFFAYKLYPAFNFAYQTWAYKMNPNSFSDEESYLVSKELEKTDVEGLYHTTEKIGYIKGKTNLEDSPSTIKYSVSDIDGNELYSGEKKFRKNWQFKNKGLIEGLNVITIEYVYPNNADNKVFVYGISNENTDNTCKLALAKKDSDKDGLSDYYEIYCSNTNPESAISGSNGVSDADVDSDNDGLTNIEEQKNGTLCDVSDSDGDGLSDKEEIENGSNPMAYDGDEDGISDELELKLGLNPNDPADAEKEVSYNDSELFNSGLNVDATITTAAKNVPTFHIYEIPKSFTISKNNIEGMVGTGICFVMDGDLKNADVEVQINADEYVDGEAYGLYYVNEELDQLEYVESQSQNGDLIEATLAHFSKYVILKLDSEGNEVKGNYNVRYMDYCESEDFLSGNEEGLYKTYKEYLNSMYNGKAVLSIHSSTPDVDSSVIYKNGYSGHAWTSYYYEGESESFKLSQIDPHIKDISYFGSEEEKYSDNYLKNQYDQNFGCFGFGNWGYYNYYFPTNETGNGFVDFYTVTVPTLVSWTDQAGKVVFGRAGMVAGKQIPGTLKVASGYSQYKAKDNFYESNYYNRIIDYKYDKNNDQLPESMYAAIISMPFVVNSEESVNKIGEFIQGYNKYYELWQNNCSSFAIDTINQSGVGYLWSSDTPAQLCIYIQNMYPQDHVYRLIYEDPQTGDKTVYYTSNRALSVSYKGELTKKHWEDYEIELRRLEEQKQLLKKFADNMSEESTFLVGISGIEGVIGNTGLYIIQESDTPSKEIEEAMSDLLTREYDGIKVKYIQLPKPVMLKIKEYTSDSITSYVSMQDFSNDVMGGFRWIKAIFFDMYYFEVSTKDFFGDEIYNEIKGLNKDS